MVDAQCRTSDPAIFAAGDATRFPGPHGLVRLENWRHAQDHGVVAGRNAAGGSEAFNAIPSFWSEQYDLYIQGVGWPEASAERVRRPLPGKSALMLEVKDGVIAYAVGINVQRDLAAIRRLIEAGRIGIDPYDPALMQPSSLDVRVASLFRVFRNSRYPFIDVKAEQDGLTELVEVTGDEAFEGPHVSCAVGLEQHLVRLVV